MPEIVLSRHGRFVLAQVPGGWEVREDVDTRRRVRWALGAVLLGAAAVVWETTGHPFALALGLLGMGLVVAGLRKKGRCLAIRESEIAYGQVSEAPLRSAVWPRSQISAVALQRGSRLAEPKLRRRVPQWTVRIQARDGAAHPARFAFSAEPPARALAEALARHLGVEVRVTDKAPKPERLDSL